MLNRRKVELVLLLAGALLAVVLLASALSGLSLEPGQLRTPSRPVVTGGDLLSPTWTVSPDVWRVVRIIILIIMPIALVSVLLSPEARRRVWANALMMAAIGLAFFLWFRNRSLAEMAGEVESPNLEPPQMEGFGSTVSPEEFVLNPPGWLAFLVTVAIVLLALFLGWLVWRSLRRRPDPVDVLAMQARQAVDDIQAGANFQDVVLRCYYDMNEVLTAERGIRRGQAATPREFEQRLLAAGLPDEPVRRLTRLFEQARYGAHAPAAEDERAAIGALTAIAQAARRDA